MLKSSLIVIGLFVSLNTSAGELTEKYNKQSLEEAYNKEINEQLTVLNEGVAAYNSNMKDTYQIKDWEVEIVTSEVSGYHQVNATAELNDGRLCKLINLNYQAVDTTPSDFRFLIGDVHEIAYNNQYKVMNLSCLGGLKVTVLRVVAGQDWLDDLNPYPNSGKVSYKIRVVSEGK